MIEGGQRASDPADRGSSSAVARRAPSTAAGVMWTLIGQAVPLLAAVLCIPALIRGLGVERFGILTLIWVVISYSSLLDLGLGRSLTKLVAERSEERDDPATARLARTALALLLVLGVAGGLVVLLAASWLVRGVLAVSAALQGEAVGALRVLALSVPAVLLSAGLKGVVEARGRFDLVNAVRAPMGIFNVVGPLISLHYSSSLVTAVAVLVVGRLISSVCFLGICMSVMPGLTRGVALDRASAGSLLRLGGLMTVSNVVAPLMAYVDRFMIGAVASMSVVAYYTSPYEIVSRVWLIPTSLATVLFPLFSRTFASDRNAAAAAFRRGIKYLFLCMFPVALVIVALAREGLAMWLGPAFARLSTPVLQCQGIGIFLCSFAYVALVLVQGGGRPDLTARVHLVELPIYLVALRYLIGAYGIFGAALAWLIRNLVEAVVLLGIARHLLREIGPTLRWLAAAATGAAAVLVLSVMLPTVATKIMFVAVVASAFTLAAWLVVLSPEERSRIKQPLARRSAGLFQ